MLFVVGKITGRLYTAHNVYNIVRLSNRRTRVRIPHYSQKRKQFHLVALNEIIYIMRNDDHVVKETLSAWRLKTCGVILFRVI